MNAYEGTIRERIIELTENINSIQSYVNELENENKKMKIIINNIFDRCDDFITTLEDFQKILVDKNYDDILKEYKAKSPNDFVRKMLKKCYDFYFFLLEKSTNKR